MALGQRGFRDPEQKKYHHLEQVLQYYDHIGMVSTHVKTAIELLMKERQLKPHQVAINYKEVDNGYFIGIEISVQNGE